MVTMPEIYNYNFYKNRNINTYYAANEIVSILKEFVPKINSAVDIGCGTGTWLNVLKNNGTDYIWGVDGEYVNTNQLCIPVEFFYGQDLNEKIKIRKKFDLVISLEVAEHLSPENATKFVKQLTVLGNIVLFSAAIPGQGGIMHINEQWPEYWYEKFKCNGFTGFDFIRDRIWNDDSIPVHYRQNIFLYVKNDKIKSLNKLSEFESNLPKSVVHPKLYKDKINREYSIREALYLLKKAIKRKINRIRMKRRL